MGLKTTLMHGECLVTVTLHGFNDEALHQEIGRRAIRRARTGLSVPKVTCSLPPGDSAEDSPSGAVAADPHELMEVISLADFTSSALVDALSLRPDFRRTLRNYAQLWTLDATELDCIRRLIASGDLHALGQRFRVGAGCPDGARDHWRDTPDEIKRPPAGRPA